MELFPKAQRHDPRAQERKFKKGHAKKLLQIAKGDIESAEVLLKSKRGRRENIGFHLQQAVEFSVMGKEAQNCPIRISSEFIKWRFPFTVGVSRPATVADPKAGEPNLRKGTTYLRG